MSLFSTPEKHAANPPETWQTVKRADRVWSVTDAEGNELTRCARKIDADTVRTFEGSWLRAAYDKEGRWYAGGSIPGWKTWADCLAERERIAARWG